MNTCPKCPKPLNQLNRGEKCTLYDAITCWLDFIYDNKLIYISNGTTRIAVQEELYSILKKHELQNNANKCKTTKGEMNVISAKKRVN